MTHRKKKRKGTLKGMLIAAVTTLSLAAPATAFAADPTASQYNNDPGQVANAVHSSGGGLPVTGLNLVALVVVAIALAGLGIVMARISRAHPHQG